MLNFFITFVKNFVDQIFHILKLSKWTFHIGNSNRILLPYTDFLKYISLPPKKFLIKFPQQQNLFQSPCCTLDKFVKKKSWRKTCLLIGLWKVTLSRADPFLWEIPEAAMGRFTGRTISEARVWHTPHSENQHILSVFYGGWLCACVFVHVSGQRTAVVAPCHLASRV